VKYKFDRKESSNMSEQYICDQCDFETNDSVAMGKHMLRHRDTPCPPGSKYDSDKLRYDLLDPVFMEGIVDVLTTGAQKYADNNWNKVPDPQNRYYAAAMRHLQAWRKGEKLDSETGKSHLYHAACCLMFLGWFDIKEGA